MSASLNIGLTAHLVVGNLCFVKVPSERGRYILTDLCVTVVPCPVCEALVGEPCRKYYGLRYWDRIMPNEKPMAHGVGVHVDRKRAAERKFGRRYAAQVASHYRVHLAAGDVAAAMHPFPDPESPPDGVDIDVPVTPKLPGAGKEG